MVVSDWYVCVLCVLRENCEPKLSTDWGNMLIRCGITVLRVKADDSALKQSLLTGIASVKIEDVYLYKIEYLQ